MIAAVLEVTLFNLPFYRLWGKNFTEMNFKAEQFASSMGKNYRSAEKDIIIKGSEEISFTLEGINEEVGNIFIDLNFENGTKGAEIHVDAMDETQTTVYRENIGKGIMVRDRWGSQFTDLQLSGKVSSMKIRIVPINGGIVYINGITLNTASPMNISLIRFLAIVLLSSLYLSYVQQHKIQQKFCGKQKILPWICLLLLQWFYVLSQSGNPLQAWIYMERRS